MTFSLKLAWSYFKRILSKGMLGVMVIISIAGIALGVASLVVTLSVMHGFHTEITSKLLALNPHIIIMSPFMDMDAASNEIFLSIDGVESSSFFIYGKGMLHSRGKSHGIIIKGVNPDTLSHELTSGSWENLYGNGIVLGGEIANDLRVKKGENVYLIIPRMANIAAPVIPKVVKLEVVGEFFSGMYTYDSSLAYINISKAESIFSTGVGHSAKTISSGIELYITAPFKAQETADLIRERIAKHYTVQTWKERNYNLFAALKLERFMIGIVLIMIIVVATFNIAGSLMMISVTRAKDIGIMRAIGVTKRQIMFLFSLKGLFIGFFGSIIGALFGSLIAFILSKYQFIELPPQVYLISTLPVRINIFDILLIITVSIVISLLATIYPSYRAGKMEVAQELRYE